MTASAASAGWHPDPTGRHQHRWWDGVQWTGHVSDGGVASLDPIAPAPLPQTPLPFTSHAHGGSPEKHPQATLVFVFGLLGILLCPLFAPFAWGIGSKARSEVAGGGRYVGDGLLTAGWVLGIIGSALMALALLWVLVVLVALGGSV